MILLYSLINIPLREALRCAKILCLEKINGEQTKVIYHLFVGQNA